MMKKILLSFMVLSLGLASCKKYVDIKKNSTEALIETTDDCQLLLDNYSQINTGYPSDGEASTDDYFLATNSFPGNLSQEDMDVHTWNKNAIRGGADPQWLNSYTIVYNANLVLEALAKIKNGDAAVINNLKGSALFLRAYALWNVAQLYAKPYSATAAQDPGVPARTSSDLNDAFGRGTVKDTYDRITQDLQDAVGLLNTTSSVASRPNKASAYAMLARVYLSMEDYGQALTNANACLQLKKDLIDYNTLSAGTTTPFSRFNAEVLFQSVMTSKSTTILAPGTASNPNARINPELYALYDANDLRKVIFFKPNTILLTYPDPANSGKTLTANVADGTYRFSGNYEQSSSAQQFSGLAIDEVYLIRAECYARASRAGDAINDLNTLLASRWKTNTYSKIPAGTAKEALDRVILERRKELLMRGLRWMDLRRLNMETDYKRDLVREIKQINVSGTSPTNYTITNTVNATYTLPANDLRYVLLIPNEVIVNAGIAQNPR